MSVLVLDKDLREKELKNKSNILFKITGMKPSLLEPKKWRILFDHNWTDKTTLDSRAKDCKFDVDALKIVNENALTL